MSLEITAHALAAQLALPDAPLLVDVREAWELAIVSLPGAKHIPLNLLPIRMNELPDVPLVVFCHHGVRSMHAVRFLRDAGFESVYSLAGGIEAWASEIAPELAHY